MQLCRTLFNNLESLICRLRFDWKETIANGLVEQAVPIKGKFEKAVTQICTGRFSALASDEAPLIAIHMSEKNDCVFYMIWRLTCAKFEWLSFRAI